MPTQTLENMDVPTESNTSITVLCDGYDSNFAVLSKLLNMNMTGEAPLQPTFCYELPSEESPLLVKLSDIVNGEEETHLENNSSARGAVLQDEHFRGEITVSFENGESIESIKKYIETFPQVFIKTFCKTESIIESSLMVFIHYATELFNLNSPVQAYKVVQAMFTCRPNSVSCEYDELLRRFFNNLN